MKNIYVFLIFCLFESLTAIGQCPCSSSGTLYPSTTMTPTSSWQTAATCQYGGEYCLFNVIAGQTYEWSYCSANGGSASWDTQLSLYDNSTLNCLAFDDDYCNPQSDIVWTATFTGVVRVKTDQYSCIANSTCATLVYKSGCNCTNWSLSSYSSYFSYYTASSGSFTVYATGHCTFHTIVSDSWINNLTFPGFGVVDYNIDNNWGCNLRTGYIYIYDCNNTLQATYTITQEGDYDVCSGWYISPTSGNYSSSANSDYFTVYGSYVSGGPCGYYVTANDSWITTLYNGTSQLNFNIDANTNCSLRTGYIYIYVSCTNAHVATFTIMQAGTSGSVLQNDLCYNPIILTQSSPCDYSGNSNCATQSQSPVTCNFNTASQSYDVWYSFTAICQAYNIQVQSGAGFDAVVELEDASCGSNIACADATASGGLEAMWVNGLTIGTTYYVRVYGYSSDGNFQICATCSPSSIQEITSGNIISIFPNPTTGELSIENTSNSEIQKIEIYNLLGQKVWEENIGGKTANKETYKINIQQLAAGSYNMQITTSKGVVSKQVSVENERK